MQSDNAVFSIRHKGKVRQENSCGKNYHGFVMKKTKKGSKLWGLCQGKERFDAA
jgi:hypothetical protein